jgi:dolichyl-phosphate-mannose--protein O-mannosyl transferase/Gpi18-like mannosyltransferase
MADSRVKAGAPVRPSAADSLAWALPLMILAGFIVRLLFVSNEGFKTDVDTFESWALALAEHGFAKFYGTAGFADYPPGYFYILAVIGHIWEGLFKSSDGGHYVVLRALVKLPAILADLGVGWLVYAVVRRFASSAIALGAAALYLFNPATIYNSAAWGQVDSVAAGLALLGIYCLLRSDDVASERFNGWIVGAWLAVGYSLLIKPQAAVVLPLMAAFALVDPARRRARLIASAIGVGAAILLALVLAEPFHPSNPIEALTWLYGRYSYGSNVYPYNSINAFNLWAIRGSFWQADTGPISAFGTFSLGPQYVWGIVLVAAAEVLVLWRYVQERTSRALLEGCAIATIAFFVLATRMHERYLFDGLLFTIACVPFARRYLWGAVALSAVLFANLQYSLQYLYVMENHVPGVNAQNLWGSWTTVLALISVGTFFWLGYQFLGGETAPAPAAAGTEESRAPAAAPALPGTRNWFDPAEGLAAMRWPLDYAIAAGFGAVNFVLSFAGYWWPPDKVFDEIYFARAGEEYLQNLRIYENTHPPLTKLLVTLSMMLFGGMPHGHGLGGWTGLNAIVGHMSNGDNAYGWRFLDVVFGALVVMLLYAFAKRITGSTIFASLTALMLTLDGMHFVQSRIATPEGFVIFFATLATYAFYRFWISSQAVERPHVRAPSWAFAAAAAIAAIGALVLTFAGRAIWKFDTATTAIVTLYLACGLYLLLRYTGITRMFGDGRRELTFGEGSFALQNADGSGTVYAADGGTIDDRGKVSRGVRSQNRGGALVYSDDPLTIEYRRDASVAYETPTATATYAQDEVRVPGGGSATGRSSKMWLVLFTVALGCLVSSKWYGVMGFGVSFLVLIAVFLQRYALRLRPALWGNPRGFRLDGALVTIVFVSATVYALVWTPDLLRHSADPNEIHNLNDVVYRQYSMFEYHDTLKATHPYSSKWWEWPLDLVPVAYFYQDHRVNQSDSSGCCIYEITSMPNPAILWFGLLCVPWVAVLAWRERNKGYALIVLTYLLQWLPWMKSPRITFAYHFYVDIPLICLCNAIVLQRVWQWGTRQGTERGRWLGGLAAGGYAALVLAAFAYFYPILAAHPISWNAWHQRMWFGYWVIGPG